LSLKPIHWVGDCLTICKSKISKESGHFVLWLRWGLGDGDWDVDVVAILYILYHIILLFWESVVICWYKPNRSGSSDMKGRWSAFSSNVGQQMWSLRERWWSTPNRVIKPGWSDISCNPRQLQWDDDMLHSHFSLRFCEWTPHSVLDRTYNSNLFLAHLCSKHVAYCRAKKLWNPHFSQWTSHFPPMNSWFWDDPTIFLLLWMTSRWMHISLDVFLNFAEWAHPKLWMKSSFCVWTGDLTGESVNKGHGPPQKKTCRGCQTSIRAS
jgi:hypothetical protein